MSSPLSFLTGSRLAATPPRFLLERGTSSGACNTAPELADRSMIQAKAWQAVDNGRAFAYSAIDLDQFSDGELLLIAARCFAELERNVREDAA